MDLVQKTWIPATIVGFICGFYGGKKGLFIFVGVWSAIIVADLFI